MNAYPSEHKQVKILLTPTEGNPAPREAKLSDPRMSNTWDSL